jgi:hypothetical protein
MQVMILTILTAVVFILAFLLWRNMRENSDLRVRFAGILNVESEIAAARKTLEQTQREQRELVSKEEQKRAQLGKEYEAALATYSDLTKEVSLLEENLEDISFGVYKPHFSFQTSEEYKAALEKLRDQERLFIRDGKAGVCRATWTVSDSKTEGKRMTKQYTKLLLRAFNGECEAAVANVSWNNVTKVEERVRKSFEALNQLGSVMQMSVTPEYLDLKLDELRLTYEYEQKKHDEREEQKRIREQIREEEKAQKEMDKAREDAEHEEAQYQKLLSKAREEALSATGTQLTKLTDQINSFEAKLDQARKAKERAISRAQLTKSGFVYVISNIGSFGEHVFKIGMTRRLEPMERIDELGGASVPFPYDLHAMLYSDNAPALETAFHQLFEERRVNLVNSRREFYRHVDLEEIETFVKQKGLSAQFIKIPEAKEYRESLALREQKAAAMPKQTEAEKFPGSIFGAAASAAN